ncbi:MAG: metallophosphoesterase [Phycisphaerae bacterium]|nr:metallophosphoesterase [Phycisphaerae bacterium]
MEKWQMIRRDFLKAAGIGLLSLPLSKTFAESNEPNKPKTDKPTDKKELPLKPFTPGSWVIAALPDPQGYSLARPGLFNIQTLWLAENAKKYNITYVLTLGDITNNNIEEQWKRADHALSRLDSIVPYTIVLGNHDYGENGKTTDRTTFANDYFPPSRFAKWRTFGGVMEEGHIENNYHLFKANGEKWLIVNLEFGPRNKTLEWMDKILTKYSDRKAIIATHAYLYSDSTIYDWTQKGDKQLWNPYVYPIKDNTNDGQEMWDKVIKKHSNVCIVVNGHVLHDGLGFLASKGDKGNTVNQMLVNFQMLENGGDSWLRLLEFLPDKKTVQVRDYSPLYDRWNTSSDNQFTFSLE